MEVDADKALLDEFWWTNQIGTAKWVELKYEHISNLWYCCGKLGHTMNMRKKDVIMSPSMQEKPLYRLWVVGHRP